MAQLADRLAGEGLRHHNRSRSQLSICSNEHPANEEFQAVYGLALPTRHLRPGPPQHGDTPRLGRGTDELHDLGAGSRALGAGSLLCAWQPWRASSVAMIVGMAGCCWSVSRCCPSPRATAVPVDLVRHGLVVVAWRSDVIGVIYFRRHADFAGRTPASHHRQVATAQAVAHGSPTVIASGSILIGRSSPSLTHVNRSPSSIGTLPTSGPPTANRKLSSVWGLAFLIGTASLNAAGASGEGSPSDPEAQVKAQG